LTDASYRGAHIALDIHSLPPHTRTAIGTAATEESVYVLLDGDVEWNGERARRADVFGDRATAVYVPPGGTIDIIVHAPSEIAAITTVDCGLRASGAATEFVRPDDVVVHDRGRPGWQRHVHDVVADNVVAAQRLLVGETFNEPGQWSSFPPHKHDGADGEPALEEVYYFRFDRRDGFGFQGLYEADGSEQAVFLRHGTIVGIPRGYHPVCAAPGYRLYYLWALVGRERRLAMYEDPAHRWLTGTT
jgi:5-deoxy-glucuronate isomerase